MKYDFDALARVIAEDLVKGTPLADSLEKIFRSCGLANTESSIVRDALIKEIEDEMDVSRVDVLSNSRVQKFVHARWIAIAGLRFLKFNISEISRALGRDRATVIYSLRAIKAHPLLERTAISLAKDVSLDDGCENLGRVGAL